MADDPAKPYNPNGFNQAKKAAFLLALAETGTITGAAARAKVHRITVYEHAKNDEEFRRGIDEARGEWEQSLVQAIAKAGAEGDVIQRRGTKIIKPGDWRAMAWLLEHSPATREAYAGILKQKLEMGGSPDLPPIGVDAGAVPVELGPDTMERLGRVVMVLLRQGVLRLPDPGEIVEPESNGHEP